MKLEAQGLYKSFEGKTAVRELSFSADSGKAFGLLGRNGAGKTTTLRMIVDVFKPDQGRILLDGAPFKPVNQKIGYLPEERGLYPKKKVGEQLVYLAQLRGMDKEGAEKNTDKWLKRLDVYPYKNKKLESLSKGNQQKVQLAQALVCDPEIVVLDEPFSGLDPVNSKVLQEVIREMLRDDKLVIFSSHQMNYIEDFCEEIAIMKDGRIVLQGKLEEIKQRFGADRLIISASNFTMMELERLCFEKLHDLATVYDKKKKNIILELIPGRDRNELLSVLMQCGVQIERFGTYKPSLTDIFVLKAGD